MLAKLALPSTFIAVKELQAAKAALPIEVTFPGMSIDVSEVQEKNA
jgi:hypothetical protein